MNTQKIVWTIVVGMVVGGVWYLLSKTTPETPGVELVATSTPTTKIPAPQTVTKPAITKPAHTTTVPKSTSNVTITGINTLSYLYELKQPLICAVTVGTTLKRSGTMYIADAKMRANFSASSMIDDGVYLYVWMKNATKGIRLSAVSSVSGSVMAGNGGFDPENPFSFSCSLWMKDASVFVPPTTVAFGTSL